MRSRLTTFGMLLALRKAGLAGKVHFVGFDASDKLVGAVRAGEIDALDFGAKESASEGQDFQVEDSCHGAPYALVSTVTFSLISKDIGGAIAKLGYDQVCGEVAR